MNAICKSCGQTLPADAPQGMCPACLLRAVLKPEDSSPGLDRFVSPTAMGPRVYLPEAIDTLRPLFPSLELISLLGYGGMGAVYKARQKKLDRLVALKIIRGDAAADPAFAERFNREARTLARLSHPGIVAIHDFGETTSSASQFVALPMFYFVMEFVDGTNLRQLMNGKELRPDQAFAIVPQVCDALQYAHDEGVVHRDIKPENILIDQRGRVKIADFGLAKLVAGSKDDFTLTGTHQVMGTPRYMAPEQMEGSHEVDHRADIYSLGVVFYEMLTGQVPAGHFDPPSCKANVDHRLDSVVLKAMARDPDRRFQRASEVRINVERVAAEFPAAEQANASREDGVAPSRPAPESMSEFLSFEAASMAGWVAGTRTKNDGMPLTIRLLLPLLCLLAIGTLFQPWLHAYISDRDALFGVESPNLTIVPSTNIKALLRSFTPVDSMNGAIAGFSLAMVLVVHLSAGQTLTRRRLSLQVALVAVALFVMLVFRQLAGTTQITVYADPESGVPPRNFVGNFQNGIGRTYLSNLEHQSEFTQAAWLGFSSMLIVLLASAFSLQYSTSSKPVSVRPKQLQQTAKRHPQQTNDVSASPASLTSLQMASRLLIGIAAITLLNSFGLLLGALVPTEVVFAGQIDRLRLIRVLLIGLLLCNLVVVCMAIVARQRILRGEGTRLAYITCVLAIPLNLIAMPFAIWCLMVLKAERDDSDGSSGATLSLRRMMRIAAVLLLIASVLVGILMFLTLRPELDPELLVETQNGDAAAVRRLLEAGANPNEYAFRLGPPLFWAVCKGDPSIIESLIEYGASVDSRTAEGITPLMVACLKGDEPTVRLLIQHGADVNARDSVSQAYTIYPRTSSINWPGRQMTPLMLAASQGHRTVVEMLLAADADSTLRDASGQDAAGLALSGNYIDVHDRILQSQGTSVNRNLSSEPLVDAAAELEAVFRNAIEKNDSTTAAEWLKLGGKVNQVYADSRTPLQIAAESGCDQVVAYLMLHGADEQKVDQEGRTALMLAVEKSQPSVVRMLLDLQTIGFAKDVQFRMTRIDPELTMASDFEQFHFEAGVDIPGRGGVMPYMKAAAQGELQIFRMMTEACLCDDLDAERRSWISHALENRQEKFLNTLFDDALSGFAFLTSNVSPAGPISPELLSTVDAKGKLVLQLAQELQLTSVEEQIRSYCNLTVQHCDRRIAEAPQDAKYIETVREQCLKAILQTSGAQR